MDDIPMDWKDGKQVPARVVEGDEVIAGTHQGSVWLKEGAKLNLAGTLQGSLHLSEWSKAVINGSHQGSVHVASNAETIINGSLQGSVHVDPGGLIQVQKGGTLAGSLSNYGIIENYGVRGGPVEGPGQLLDHPGSKVKTPIIRNGIHIYEW